MVHVRGLRLASVSVASLLFLPLPAFALAVGGTTLDLAAITDNIITFMATSITSVATAMFLVGAFMIVISGAKEDFKQKGKDLMIGSIISILVVLGAFSLYRTVAYFLS